MHFMHSNSLRCDHRAPWGVIVVLIAAFACLGGSVALAQDTDGATAPAVIWNMADANPGTPVTAAGVAPNTGAIDVVEGGRVALPVLDTVLNGTVTRRRVPGEGRFTLSGALDAAHGLGHFVIAVNGDRMTAAIHSGHDGAWKVYSNDDGAHAVEWFDGTEPAPCMTEDVTAPLVPEIDDPAAAGSAACGDGTVVDVLVFMTSGAVDDAGGLEGAIASVDMMVEDANLGFMNSGVNVQLNLVHFRRLFVQDDVASLSALTNPNDGIIDEVHTVRDAYGADEVVLVYSGGGGVANGLAGISPQLERLAFCRAGLASAFNSVFAHEVGHNLGACHAVGDGGGCGIGLLFDFSNGYRFTGDSGPQWRTIMAYSPGIRIVYFSSPNVEFDGQPTGLPLDAMPFGADNVRTFGVSTYLVSNFRCNDTICEDLALAPDAVDCDGNGVPDACDLALGWAMDVNGNEIPDQCECTGDVDGDETVGFADLLRVFASWGTACSGCPEDADGNGNIGAGDVQRVIGDWGPCGF